MQIPLESEIIFQLFGHFAPLHACSLSVSESVDPNSFDDLQLKTTIERNPRQYYTTSKSTQKTDLLFLAASDIPNNIEQTLFYFSSINPGGIAIIETNIKASKLDYTTLVNNSGMRIIYTGTIYGITNLTIPKKLRSHANTQIIVIEKKIPTGQYPQNPILTILNINPLKNLDHWKEFLTKRSMNEYVQIVDFEKTNNIHKSLQNPTTHLSKEAKTDHILRSKLCQIDSRFILIDDSSENKIPCDEIFNLLLVALKENKEPKIPFIVNTKIITSDKLSGRKTQAPKIQYQLWNRKCAEYYFEHSAWVTNNINWKKPELFIKQAKGQIIHCNVRTK